jgi:hypothetical protein
LLKPLRQLEDNEYFGLKSSSMSISISRHGHPSLRSNRHIKWPVDGIRTIDVCSLLFSNGHPFHPIRVPSIIETIEHLQRRSPLSALTAEQVIGLLTRYTSETGASLEVLLVGALALQAYGYQDRLTRDFDAEIVGSVDTLTEFLSRHSIPADLTTNFSGWSVVAMPPGYRDRATNLVVQSNLRVRLLAPVDFVISKLRRGTDLDLDDAGFVAKRYHLNSEQIRTAAAAALAASPKDTALFLFNKTVDLFCKSVGPDGNE